jgi:integrase
VRDAAVILLGYASAMRRSELTALTLLDVEEKTDGLLVTIRQSKTDQEGQGQIVAVARGENPETDPVAALAAWRRLRGHEPGPLFTRFFRSRVSLQPLSGDAIARMLRARAHAAGLDAERITAHSLRAGHATTAALGGVPLARIAAQTRHRDLSVLVNRYIPPLEALATTSSRDLGL